MKVHGKAMANAANRALIAVVMVALGCGTSRGRAGDAGLDVAFAVTDVGGERSLSNATAPQETSSQHDAQAVPDGVAPSFAPTISTLSAAVVARGAELEVDGANFSSNPIVVLGEMAVSPSSSSATRLVVRIPSDFPLAACDADVSLKVATDTGTSSPASVTIFDPGPTIFGAPAPVPAGNKATLTGCGLSGAIVTLNGAPASVEQVMDTQVVIDVPRTFATGPTTLALTTTNGALQQTITVLPREPLILSTDLSTVAPDAVVRMTIDAISSAQVATVKVGANVVSATDPSVSRWDPAPGTAGTNILSIRIPKNEPLGSAGLSLAGSFGSSGAVPVMVIAPAPLLPPAPPGIVIPPSGTGGQSYPLGVTTPFPLDEPGATGGPDSWTGHWTYNLAFNDPGNGPSCTGQGTVKGNERYCQTPPCGGQTYYLGSDSNCSTPEFTVCSPIKGTFHIGTAINSVDLQIDRTSSGGTVEEYTGGWVQPDGVTPVTASVHSANLVLRSKATGVQLTIEHGVSLGCNSDQ